MQAGELASLLQWYGGQSTVLHNTQEKQDVQVQRNVGLVAQAAKEAKLKLEVEAEMRDLDLKT